MTHIKLHAILKPTQGDAVSVPSTGGKEGNVPSSADIDLNSSALLRVEEQTECFQFVLEC